MVSVYERAVGAWKELGKYREERERCKRYVFGDQWSDRINVGNGVMMKEEDAIMSYGQLPLKNNILRRIVRNVIGVYRSQYYKVPMASPEDYPEGMMKEVNRRRKRTFHENRMEELVPRLLEEFLLSGLVAVKIAPARERGGVCRILPVTPDNFFFHSDGYDPRGWNVDLIGEMHAVSYATLATRFCKSPEDLERLEALYGGCRENCSPCRVAEVWHLEERVMATVHDRRTGRMTVMPMEEAAERLRAGGPALKSALKVGATVSREWCRTWLAPDGSVLREERNAARMHPYVFKAYPFVDGEMHSYISDIIDQQRYVNRLITLYDFIMKSSAKGVLLFPDSSIPRGWDLQDVADEWARFNSVIPYRATPGVPMPTQVSVNSTNIGIAELLKIELQMLEDISSVSPTLQGKLETTATSGALFARQNEAAQTSLLDILRSFGEMVGQIALAI